MAAAAAISRATPPLLRTALVTGGNRGIGFEVCRRLALQGWKVYLGGRNSAAVNVAVENINRKLALDMLAVSGLILDVSDSKGIATSLHSLEATSFNLVINNAGVLEDGWTSKIWKETMTTNLSGPLDVISGVRKMMVDSSLILNVSSGYGSLAECPSKAYRDMVQTRVSVSELRQLVTDDGFMPDDPGAAMYVPAYRVSKCALNRATQLLSVDEGLVGRSIAVAACCPGWVRTRMGGSSATRSVEEGAASVLATVNDHFKAVEEGVPSPVAGGFFRDGKALKW